jgi:predicted nucleotide-binding protein (sugar kinase/HSP70/actin superfamily)
MSNLSNRKGQMANEIGESMASRVAANQAPETANPGAESGSSSAIAGSGATSNSPSPASTENEPETRTANCPASNTSSAFESHSSSADAASSPASAARAANSPAPKRTAGPLSTVERKLSEGARGVRVSVGNATRPFKLRPNANGKGKKKRKQAKRDRHARTRVAFFRYSYYDIAFKFFVEQVLDAEFVTLPPATKRTVELGSKHSSDFVCAPFKHILGDYIEALELGADVLVQFAGPCRLGYYGELQESILRDLGYEFDMINFAQLSGQPVKEYVEICKRKVNPDVSVPRGVVNMLATFKLLQFLDEANDFYLANAAFSVEPGAFARAREAYYADMRAVTCEKEIVAAHRAGMDRYRAIPLNKPANPVRVGLVGEYFTAADAHSNLGVEEKLINMGVEVHRMLNMTNRNLRYNEKNLRASISDYVTYDMGPTSSMTLAAALKYAQEGFDGCIHLKSSGCTPEIDCMPVLQHISRDTGMPILYLSYDSQTSDTGLDTRLEAFYDMLAMKKEKNR